MEEQIAKCALQHYETVLPSNKGKPKDNEWTVFAAVVAVQKNGNDNQLWVVSCATGTKCATFVPPKEEEGSSDNGKFELETTVLRDCHAEALTRRGLMKVLWKEISHYEKEGGSVLSSQNRLLDAQPDSTVTNPKFALRKGLGLHLYVSDPPCGDASIYPLTDHNSKEGKMDTASNSITSNSEVINFTGAKVIVNQHGVKATDCTELLSSHQQQPTNNKEDSDRALVAREDVQLLGKLRTKSGRSNLPAHMRSNCMSCSDKLVRWCVLGLQGYLLAKYIPTAIRLESIVVSHDLRALSEEAQKKALCRATQNRVVATLSYLQGQVPEADKLLLDTSWTGPPVHIVSPRFARGKSSMEHEKAKSNSTIQHSQEDNKASSKKRKRDASKNNKNSMSPCGICLNWNQSSTDVEQIVGARGLCQGKKPKSARDYRRQTSRLSRASLAEHAQLVGNKSQEKQTESMPSSYQQWKQSHGDATYQRLRSILFQGGPLAGWLTS